MSLTGPSLPTFGLAGDGRCRGHFGHPAVNDSFPAFFVSYAVHNCRAEVLGSSAQIGPRETLPCKWRCTAEAMLYPKFDLDRPGAVGLGRVWHCGVCRRGLGIKETARELEVDKSAKRFDEALAKILKPSPTS